MKRHTKIYLKSRGLTGHEFIPCEGCGGRQVVDVHHLKGRVGKDADNPANLAGLCRECHQWAHKSKANNEELMLKISQQFIA